MGEDVYISTGLLTIPVGLGPGTYWLTLQNANDAFGSGVLWDQNSGPSSAFENFLGTIPSETFQILGGGGTTPEPGSIMLFGTGILGLAGVLRRKLF